MTNARKHALILGHDADGRSLIIGREAMVRHVFVVGATGSGKTNQVLGMAAGAISGGLGLAFVDGKGDLSAYRRIVTLARRHGREADLRLLNFRDAPPAGSPRVSNTFNPFATGTVETLVQFLVGMMDEVGGDGAMWKGRAIAMLSGVMRALVDLRDMGLLHLNVSSVRDHVGIRRIIDLCDAEKYPQLDERSRKAIRSYLTSLPGYQEEKKYKQSQTTLDQHGYLEMQFTRLLGAFGEVYAHVFSGDAGEVDLEDLRRGRRILVVLLPMVGRSGEERRFLGSTVMAILNGMMSAASGRDGLPGDPVGDAGRDEPPFVAILDEFSTFAVPGMEALAAQGRSLGFSFTFATQTLVPPAHDPEGHVLDGILANTATKVLMRTDLVDRARFSRLVPGPGGDAAEEGLAAMRERMVAIQGLVALQAVTGDGKGASALAFEYAGLAERQAAAHAARAAVPDAGDLPRLATGEMLLLQAGRAVRARAYDLSDLPETPGPVVGSVPYGASGAVWEAEGVAERERARSGDPRHVDPAAVADAGGDLQALGMLPPADREMPAADLVRLSVAICAAASE